MKKTLKKVQKCKINCTFALFRPKNYKNPKQVLTPHLLTFILIFNCVKGDIVLPKCLKCLIFAKYTIILDFSYTYFFIFQAFQAFRQTPYFYSSLLLFYKIYYYLQILLCLLMNKTKNTFITCSTRTKIITIANQSYFCSF